MQRNRFQTGFQRRPILIHHPREDALPAGSGFPHLAYVFHARRVWCSTPEGDSDFDTGHRVSHRVPVLLTSSCGNYHRYAAKLKVSRTAINHRVAASPELTTLVSELPEGRLEMAESAIDAAVAKGQAWAVCFLLKTRGKQRGYSERAVFEVKSTITEPIKQQSNVGPEVTPEALMAFLGDFGITFTREPSDSKLPAER